MAIELWLSFYYHTDRILIHTVNVLHLLIIIAKSGYNYVYSFVAESIVTGYFD